MRLTSQLVTAIRELSRNKANSDATVAISDEEILQYLNDAQDRLQNLISATKNCAKIFVSEVELDIVGGQEAYTVPDRVLLNKQIEQVDYSTTGQSSDYVILEKLNFINRDTQSSAWVKGYIKRGNQLLLQPVPSITQGKIRILFERELDDLDIPRGTIASITNGTSTGFDALVLNTDANSYETTTPGWSTIRYCCVVSPDGARRAFNIPVSSYNTGSNTITPSGGFVYGDGDSEIQAGDVALFGKYATTLSQLPDNCERYLVHYGVAEMFHKDSASDYNKELAVLGEIENDILRALSSQTSEIQYIPQANRYEWW